MSFVDERVVDLDGLNLSRPWCWRSIAAGWAASDQRRAIALEAADAHPARSLRHLTDTYMGEHCLATFVLLAAGAG